MPAMNILHDLFLCEVHIKSKYWNDIFASLTSRTLKDPQFLLNCSYVRFLSLF